MSLPVIRFFESLLPWTTPEPAPARDVPVAAEEPLPSLGACTVAGLDPIGDSAALQLENSLDVVDITGMEPAAAGALQRFQSNVERAGGTMILKSAYRPAAYQQHLQNVWYKWMELRNNYDPACQDLKAQVQDEFKRHRLIESQHPVAVSDHTRGLAFDATVELPNHARFGRRHVTLDTLARIAGLLRPAIASDPVHFKYVGGTRYVAAVRRVTRRRNA